MQRRVVTQDGTWEMLRGVKRLIISQMRLICLGPQRFIVCLSQENFLQDFPLDAVGGSVTRMGSEAVFKAWS
jgi:hypothetical protein